MSDSSSLTSVAREDYVLFPLNFSAANQDKQNFEKKEEQKKERKKPTAKPDYVGAFATLCLCEIISEGAL